MSISSRLHSSHGPRDLGKGVALPHGKRRRGVEGLSSVSSPTVANFAHRFRSGAYFVESSKSKTGRDTRAGRRRVRTSMFRETGCFDGFADATSWVSSAKSKESRDLDEHHVISHVTITFFNQLRQFDSSLFALQIHHNSKR